MEKLPALNKKKLKAIELMAHGVDMTDKDVAIECGVTPQTLVAWKKDPEFHEEIYKRWASTLGTELKEVGEAMFREAKAGNVQAARMLFEHSGKLSKNVNVTIQSPWEIFQKEHNIGNVEEAEIVEEVVDYFVEQPKPERKVESAKQRDAREKAALNKASKKEKDKKAYNEKRKMWYQWKKRAEAVGVEPLSARRPTKGQRTSWEQEIIKRENGNKTTKETIK